VKIYGISLVRNEVDIIRTNVRYHLSLGFDRLLIVDNGSTDGTERILRNLDRNPRVCWIQEPGPYRQAHVFTRLARRAFQEGADWVLPVDADEFWYAPRGDMRGVLAATEASMLQVRLVDFVQRRSQKHSSSDALLHMTRRPARKIEDQREKRKLISANKASYIELGRMPKVASRPSADIQIARGAHSVSGVEGTLEETDELLILHAPLRSFEDLRNKAGLAERRRAPGENVLKPSWQTERWERLESEGRLWQEWAANSYDVEDTLKVYGKRRPVVFDPTLRDAVEPFLQPSLRERISAGIGRLTGGWLRRSA
jgi:hypothetical protein